MDQTNLYKKGSISFGIVQSSNKTVSELFMLPHEIEMAKALRACIERLGQDEQAEAALKSYEKEASRRYWQDAKEWRNT